ncbi:uncharacterized protein MONBRDRAFT_33628 [Monosiga brevicollis MX1]|uniref:Cytochrome b-c1 complex subunit 2, mitochondrial n=1 Tax=Monosiga brevicollis TaxID=81824 RepID=A9V6M9_MONBE|nr:uncharacterized protein MONBRDRAFT_33628 [Monosiga brevicollis MX1]EDQ86836.1 predicted protein [Monosiga brevicollis MX1]|eukprot:XP_001748381.1 hypothetical protein [Monosiga brevicollis MX1]
MSVIASAARVRPQVAAAQRLYASAVSATDAFPGTPSVTGTVPAFGSIETTRLNNGVVIATQDNGGVASAMTIAVGAGSRNETAATFGATHFLRNLAFTTTQQRSAVKITRESELRGAQLSATSARDHLQYNARFLRSDTAFVSELVAETVATPSLEEWVVAGQRARVSGDVAAMAANGYVALIDDVHRAAFRGTPLGRPIVCPASSINKVSAESVIDFRNQLFAGSNVVVSAVNVDHQAVVDAVSDLLGGLAAVSVDQTQSQYFGGDSVIPTDDAQTNVVIGFKAPAAGASDALAALVARNLLGGNGSALKWSSDATASRIGAEAAKAASGPFQASAFASLYSDIGLVGVHVTANTVDVKPVVSGAVEGIKAVVGGKFTDEEFAAAKAQLKQSILIDSAAGRAQDIAAQLLNAAAVETPEAVASQVDNVSKDQVAAVLKSFTAQRPVFAARGNVDNLPYLDTLGL